MPKVVGTAEVRSLLDAGAQVVEVLPEEAWRQEHLPGAVNIPLTELRADAIRDLDPSAPTVVYCYDHECDLSARAAAVFETLGFTDVYDYAESKTAWLGSGLPAEGEVLDTDRAGSRATRPPTCGPEATIGDLRDDLSAEDTIVVVVVNADDVVLGAVHPHAASLPSTTGALAAADPGPATVRPSITRFELAESMDKEGEHHMLVSTFDGRLVGIVRREELG